MKAKLTAKKILSVILATLMLFSAMSVSVSAEAEKCPHNLGEEGWEIIKEPTCNSSGIKQKWCSECGFFAQKEIPNDMTKHVPGLWTTVVAHTCYQDGYDVVYCEYGCTDPDTGERIVLAERTTPKHDFSVLYGEEPTCVSTGYAFSICLSCYESKTEELAIRPNAHKLSEEIIYQEATCVKDSGIKRHYCLNPGCSYEVLTPYTAPDNHKNVTWYEDKTVHSTCAADGFVPGICNDCNEEVRDIIPRHSESEYEVLSTVPSTCHSRGYELRRCKGIEVNGVFVGCGLEYKYELELDADNHVYTDWITVKEASCQVGERYKSCIYEPSVKYTEIIPANGEHKFGEWVDVEEATCSLTGIREKVCTVCNGEAEGGKITEVTPVKHDFASWETKVEMNCNEETLKDGKEIAYCDKCAYTKTFTIYAEHNFTGWKTVVKPDCRDNSPGKRQRTCLNPKCGKVETEEFYIEHDFTDWMVTDVPTCDGEKTGMYTKVCKSCKKAEHKVIPSAHEYGDWECVSYGLCAKGNDEPVKGVRERTCKFCGDKETDSEFVPEHTYSEWKTVKKEGDKYVADSEKNYACRESYQQMRTCYTCGNVELKSVVKDHSFGNWYNPAENGKTCDEGATAVLTRKCTKCDVTETTDTPVSLTHPNLKTIVTKPTCTTTGYTQYVCPDCGYKEIDEEIGFKPANGHNFDENWTTRVQATCKAPGSRYKACSECDYLQFEAIDRAAHVLVQTSAGIEPTCTEAGLTSEAYCGVCFEQFNSQVIPALGHTYAEGSETCSRCYVYAGSPDESCVCACHSSSGMEAIIFGIMCKLYSFFGINQFCKCGVMHYEEVGFFAKLFGKA